MNILLLYALGVLLLIILGLVVIFNFLRYRFKGDKTILFLFLYCVLFVVNIVITLVMLNSSALTF